MMYNEIKSILPQQIDSSTIAIVRKGSKSFYNFTNEDSNNNIVKNKLSKNNNQLKNKNINIDSRLIKSKYKNNENDSIKFKYIFSDSNKYTNINSKRYKNNQISDNKTKLYSQIKSYTEKPIKNNIKVNNNVTESKDWIILLILLSLFVLSIVRLVYYKTVQHIIKSSYDFKLSQKIYRERNSISQRVSFFLNLIFIINISLFIYFTLNYYKIHFFKVHVFILYLIFFGIISSIYILKYIANIALGWLLLNIKYFKEYLFNMFIYMKILGILLLPIIIGIPFMPKILMPILINIGIGIIILCLIARTIRGIQLSFRFKFSILYLFLYLCTLEFLPLLILMKILTL